MQNHRIWAAWVIGFLALAPLVAAADAVTYDFTGTVIGATGDPFVTSVPIGTEVTGTYTFDFGAAFAADTFGTPGSQSSDWYIGNRSGTTYGTPAFTQYVFSSTAHVGSLSYATDPTYAQGNYLLSAVSGGTATGPSLYFAQEGAAPATAYAETSNLTLLALQGQPGPWTASGLPNFGTAQGASGSFTIPDAFGENTIGYNITSLTPVPLPAAAWLLLCGLGGFGAFARKRRIA